jgi:hypothetical protein
MAKKVDAEPDPLLASLAIPTGSWVAAGPVVIRDGDLLVEGLGRKKKIDRDQRLRGLVDRFAELADPADPKDPDRRILAFANRWGLLGLCPHGLGHHEWNEIPQASEPVRRRGCRMGREPLAMWRALAGAVRSALALADALHRGSGTLEHDWDRVLVFHRLWAGGEVFPMDARNLGERATFAPLDEDSNIAATMLSRSSYLQHTRQHGRNALAGFLYAWSHVSKAMPVLDWQEKSAPEFRIATSNEHLGLFAALGVQLMGAVSRTVRPGYCDNCGDPLGRTARTGKRNFCKKKRCQKEARALWARELRARRKAEGGSHGKA